MLTLLFNYLVGGVWDKPNNNFPTFLLILHSALLVNKAKHKSNFLISITVTVFTKRVIHSPLRRFTPVYFHKELHIQIVNGTAKKAVIKPITNKSNTIFVPKFVSLVILLLHFVIYEII